MIWHKWREIFIKSIILFLANMVTFDTQIMTISELFSHEMIKLIFSEKSLEIYIMLLIMILITYNISVVILKIIEYVKDKKVYDENSKKTVPAIPVDVMEHLPDPVCPHHHGRSHQFTGEKYRGKKHGQGSGNFRRFHPENDRYHRQCLYS